MRVRFVSLLSLMSAAMIAATFAPPVAKAKFSESIRYESRTITESFGGSSTSSTESASRGKWSLTAEIPLDSAELQAIGPDTAFEVSIGRLDSSVSLKDDAKYKAGKANAQFDLRQAKVQDASPVAVAKLNWNREKLTVNLSPKKKESPALVAMGLVGNPIGDLKGVAKLTIRFGEKTTTIDIPFTGKLDRKTLETEMVSGQAVTIEMSGETK
jgi:hypothetical protein